MFEKDAEEYGEKDLGGKYLSSVVAKDKLHAYKLGQFDGFVAGAEFGYNKGKTEIQEKLKADLIADLEERMQYSTSPSCTKGMELFIKSIEKWEIKENE